MSVSDYFNSGKRHQFIINILEVAFTPIIFNQIAFVSVTLAVCRHYRKTDGQDPPGLTGVLPPVFVLIHVSVARAVARAAYVHEQLLIIDDYSNISIGGKDFLLD
jgi:hypothetical protein